MLHRILFLLALACPLAAIAAPLTLSDAWRRAEESNPILRTAQAELSAAQAVADEVVVPFNSNPQLSLERRRRTPSIGDIQREWSAGISQTFEIAGQPGARRQAAEATLASSQAELAEIRRRLHAEVERAFVNVLSLQLRLVTEQHAARLVADAENLVRKRVAAGEDNRLDGNLARVEAERARNQAAQLAERLTEARAELATLLRLPPDALPEVAGELETASPAYTLADLLAAAEARPALQALGGREAAAKARVDLERGAAWPDVTLGLSVAREGPLDARDKITGVNLSLPLPLFRRNQAAIGRAMAEHTQAQAERESGQRETIAKVHTLWAQLASLRERVRGLSETVQPALDENRSLSLAAYKYGELGLPQLLMVQRQALDGQRDLLEARTDLRLTRITLEAAAGWQHH